MSAKTEGQRRSLTNLPSESHDAFMAVIESITVGQIVHVNAVRPLLTLAEVPPKAMGGLFAQAVIAGLLTPMVTYSGDEIRRKSDGASAHHATCRLYTRTRP
jgi:hypothetical protein